MIFENAFVYLPEILTGSNYAVQQYEAGIVNAISLAALQELNARNVPNPLSFITVEKLYSVNGFPNGISTLNKRYLRADLYIDTARTYIATEPLSRFGWRHENWLEAKFFRNGKIPSTSAAALLAGDFIRLCILVSPFRLKKHNQSMNSSILLPGGKCSGISVARYLLHVYDIAPTQIIGKRGRTWLQTLRKAGEHRVVIDISKDRAVKTFINVISSQLRTLKITANITNMILQQTPKNTSYLCVLTRINSFEVTLEINGDTHIWKEDENRNGEEGSTGDWETIRNTVGAHLLLTAKHRKTEDTPPSADELTQQRNDSDDTDIVNTTE